MRSRSRPPLAIALALASAVMIGLVVTPGSQAAGSNGLLISNSGFERGLAGWRGHRSTLRLVRGTARVLAKPGRRSSSIYRWPRPQSSPGTIYRASASVRARPSLRVCLALREWAGSSVVGSATRCLTATPGWRRFPAVVYKARGRGTRLGISIVSRARRAGRTSFTVDGVKLATRSAATATAGAAAPRPLPTVGVQFHCGWSDTTDAEREAVLAKLQAAGVNWVRIGVGWASLQERNRDEFTAWYAARIDRCFELARLHGMSILATLSGTPDWANGGRGTGVPPSDPSDYARAAQWAAGRWAGKVAAWEIWNEPDPSQTFWLGSVGDYVGLLKLAYPAIKSGDPSALVVFGGPSGNNDRFIDDAYAAGAKGSFDVMATHPYQGLSDAEPERADDGNRWWLTHLPTVREVMLKHGDDKPIWFTEFGWSSHTTEPGAPNWRRGVTEAQQADFLARAVRLTQERYEPVTHMFWYTERDRTQGNLHWNNFGLLRTDLSEKPAYATLRQLLAGR